MALNIKPYYPFEHPSSELSTAELIQHISRPTNASPYLKTEIEKKDIFERYDDLYSRAFTPSWRDKDHDINEKAVKLLDVI
tara:strand:- start:226 stop:468 length:243 start_codon:yes stop_codon:yes gene_type:complete